ncbi:hypothetical protein HDV05_004013 [Chytridiales sp. JEL 0842]|nr:hypothetical protein HDV05_004013 [Chytridiales sp. JEL 0842]
MDDSIFGEDRSSLLADVAIDPTQPSSAEQLKAAKWLPPLAESARALTTPAISTQPKRPGTKSSEARPRRLMDAPPSQLPNIPLAKDRFPVDEIKKAKKLASHIRSNPNMTFLVALKEKALKQEESAKRREEKLKRSQETKGIAWDMIRPLSRDPQFGKYIVQLSHLSKDPNMVARIFNTEENEDGDQDISADNIKSTSSLATGSHPPSRKSKVKKPLSPIQPATPPKKLVKNNSLTELRGMIEKSVFRPRPKGAPMYQHKEEPLDNYQFGRPQGYDEDRGEEYSRTFKDITSLGNQVVENLKLSEHDKRNFSARRGKRLSGDRYVEYSNEGSNEFISHSGTPSTAPKKKQSPALKHRNQFLECQQEAQKELAKTLADRRRDRLKACRSASTLKPVLRVLRHDMKDGFNVHSHNDAKSWMSVLPYIWVENINERLKVLEPGIVTYSKGQGGRHRRGGANITGGVASIKEKMSLFALFLKDAALAGHQRMDSLIDCAERLQEYQHLMEGKDIVADRAQVETTLEVPVIPIPLVPCKNAKGPQYPVTAQEKEIIRHATTSNLAIDTIVKLTEEVQSSLLLAPPSALNLKYMQG